jgi:hypothetical protein
MMTLSPNGGDLNSGGDADPLISAGLASNPITRTHSSNDPFLESLHPQEAESILFSGSEGLHQYPELPKLDGLDNLHSNLDSFAVDEGDPRYPKITFRQPQTMSSAPLRNSHTLAEPFSFRFESPWSASSTKKRARRKSSNHGGSPIEPYSASSSATSTFILTPESMLFAPVPARTTQSRPETAAKPAFN